MLPSLFGFLLAISCGAAPADGPAPASVLRAETPQEPVSAPESYREQVAAQGEVHQGTDEQGRAYSYWIRRPAQESSAPVPALFFFHCRGWGDPVTKNHLLEREFEVFRDEALRRGYAIVAVSYGENSWMY